MNITVTWNPGDTWRKLGYYYYTDSLDYRTVLEQNPQWNVITEPPTGAVLILNVDNTRTAGTTTNSGFFPQVQDGYIDQFIFPFESQTDYDAQASKYNLYGILNYNECNGYTQDTPQAAGGSQ
jgi:hypothetical protein